MKSIDLDTISCLQDVCIFQNLDVVALEAVAQKSTIKSFSKGEEILCAGDDTTDLYTILSGRARVLNYSLSGREVVYDDLFEGGIFGEICALDGMGRSANVIAQAGMEVMITSREVFLEMLRTYPQVGIDLSMHLAAIIRADGQRIFDSSTKNSRIRLMQFLLGLAEESSPDHGVIREKMTHKIIAGRVGSARETVTRLLHQLITEGLLARDEKLFTIPSLKAMRVAIQHEEG